MDEAYYIFSESGKMGPFSIKELRMVWNNNKELTSETQYLKVYKEFDEKTSRLIEKRKEGVLGEIRTELRPMLSESSNNQLSIDSGFSEKEEGPISIEKNEKDNIEDNIEDNIDDFKADTAILDEIDDNNLSSKKEYKKTNRNLLLRRVALLLVLAGILYYILVEVALAEKLKGTYNAGNVNFEDKTTEVYPFLNTLVFYRDILQVEPGGEQWAEKLKPTFIFKPNLWSDKFTIRQGLIEAEGYVDYKGNIAFLRFYNYPIRMTIRTDDRWDSFTYNGMKYNKGGNNNITIENNIDKEDLHPALRNLKNIK